MVLMDLLINWMGFIDGNNGDQPIYLLYLKYPNMWHRTGANQKKWATHPKVGMSLNIGDTGFPSIDLFRKCGILSTKIFFLPPTQIRLFQMFL